MAARGVGNRKLPLAPAETLAVAARRRVGGRVRTAGQVALLYWVCLALCSDRMLACSIDAVTSLPAGLLREWACVPDVPRAPSHPQAKPSRFLR